MFALTGQQGVLLDISQRLEKNEYPKYVHAHEVGQEVVGQGADQGVKGHEVGGPEAGQEVEGQGADPEVVCHHHGEEGAMAALGRVPGDDIPAATVGLDLGQGQGEGQTQSHEADRVDDTEDQDQDPDHLPDVEVASGHDQGVVHGGGPSQGHIPDLYQGQGQGQDPVDQGRRRFLISYEMLSVDSWSLLASADMLHRDSVCPTYFTPDLQKITPYIELI